MAIIKKPIKKILWGLSLFFGLALVFFVKIFGINSLNRIELDKSSLLGMIGISGAQADTPGGPGGPGSGGGGDSSY